MTLMINFVTNLPYHQFIIYIFLYMIAMVSQCII